MATGEPEPPSSLAGSSDVVSNALVRSLQEQLTGARSENLHLTKRLLVVEEELAQRQRQHSPAPPVDTEPWRQVAAEVLVQALAQAELELLEGSVGAQGYREALTASEESRAKAAAGLRAATARVVRLEAELKQLAEELEKNRARSSEEAEAAGRAALQQQELLAPSTSTSTSTSTSPSPSTSTLTSLPR